MATDVASPDRSVDVAAALAAPILDEPVDVSLTRHERVLMPGLPPELQPEAGDIWLDQAVWPWSDLNAKLTPEHWLYMARRVIGAVALMTVQTPAGPKLVNADASGNLGLQPVTIAGIAQVTINGVPTVQFASGQTVAITGNVSVNINAGQSVSITGGVTISGTPTVQFAAGQSVSITAGTVTVQNVTGTYLQALRSTPTGIQDNILFHPFSGTIAAGGTLVIMSSSTVGISLYYLHLIVDAGFTLGSSDLTLERGIGNTILDRFSTAFPGDYDRDMEGSVIPLNNDVHLRNNAAQSVTVRGTLCARDQALG